MGKLNICELYLNITIKMDPLILGCFCQGDSKIKALVILNFLLIATFCLFHQCGFLSPHIYYNFEPGVFPTK